MRGRDGVCVGGSGKLCVSAGGLISCTSCTKVNDVFLISWGEHELKYNTSVSYCYKNDSRHGKREGGG